MLGHPGSVFVNTKRVDLPSFFPGRAFIGWIAPRIAVHKGVLPCPNLLVAERFHL